MAKILIVDDSPKIRVLAEQLLQQSGHTIATASDGYSAIDIILDQDFDLIILDINMPYKNGFSVLSSIKKASKPDVKVIILSGRNTKRDLQQAITLGADNYIVKPIQPQKFIEKVNDTLKNQINKKTDISLSPSNKSSFARVTFSADCHILKISEFDIKIFTSQNIKIGQELCLNGLILSDIDIESIRLKVFSTQAVQGGYESKLIFLKNNTVEIEKIRNWLKNNPVKTAS